MPEAATLLKKRLLHRCFPGNMQNFQEHFFYRTLQKAASKMSQNGC